jgi:hypothetical protein
MEAIQDKSGQLSDNQLFGCDVPVVCTGYLPDELREKLELSDAGILVCPTHNVPCPALNERTGECESKVCVLETEK